MHLVETRKRQASTLLGAIVIQVVATANTLAFPVLVPSLPGGASGLIGPFMMVLYAGAMVGAGVSGGMIARMGPVRASQFSLLLQVLGLSCIALAGVFASASAVILVMHWVGAFTCGFAYGPITPASAQMLMRIATPERSSFVFSLKQTGVPMGGLLVGLTLPPIASSVDWLAGFMAMAVLTCLTIVLVNPLVDFHDRAVATHAADSDQTKHNVSKGGSIQAIVTILRDPQWRSVAIESLLFSVCQLCVGSFLMVYLHQEVKFDPIEAGRIYALTQFAGIVGRLGWGRLADVFGSPTHILRVLALIMVVSVFVTGFFSTSWPLWLMLVVVTVLGGTAIGWNGVFLGEIARRTQHGSIASVTGGVLVFTYVGVVIGPVLFGYAGMLLGGLGHAFMLLTLVPLAALVLLCRR